MRSLVKFIVAFLIAAISVAGANEINQTLSNAQDKVAKSYKQKRTEERSFKNIEEAKSYTFEKGSKIESIAKEIGIEYIITDDKGLFYYSDGDLTEPSFTKSFGRVYSTQNSKKISWTAAVSEYSSAYSNKATTEFAENLRMFTYCDFSDKKEAKEDIVVKFLYKYLIEVENLKITYNELLDDLKETAQRTIDNNTNEEVRLQLTEGLYAVFTSKYSMDVKINLAYRTRVVKQVNPDIKDYFISVKNSKEIKDNVLEIYERYHKLNEETSNYSYSETNTVDEYDESIPLEILEPGIGTFNYNTKAYPDLSKGEKIYVIDFSIYPNTSLEQEESSIINYKKMAYRDGSKIYDLIYNEVYSGNYPLSKEEFVDRYVKIYLQQKLYLLERTPIEVDINNITPGITVLDGNINCRIPLSFIK